MCDSQGYVRQTEDVQKDHGRLETWRVALNMMRVNDERTLSMRWRKMRALSNVGYREQRLFGNRSPAA